MVLYIGIYIESDWLYHAEWVALSNGQSGSELAEYSVAVGYSLKGFYVIVYPFNRAIGIVVFQAEKSF